MGVGGCSCGVSVVLICLLSCGGSSVVDPAGGGLAGGGATPHDAGALTDADAAPLEDAGTDAEPVPYCPIAAEPTANLEITSSLGDHSGRFAWFGNLGGECGGLRLVVVEDLDSFDEVLASSSISHVAHAGNMIEAYPDTYDPATGSWLGTGPTSVHHWLEDVEVVGEGTVTIEAHVVPQPEFGPTNTPTLRGQLVMTDPGWSGGGSFTAPYCEHLTILCP